jgi:hypothetical protein
VNGNDSLGEEIKGRISLGNKAFYANHDPFKSKLLTENSKLRMYKTLVRQTDRPVVTYGCETWVLKENINTKLRVFERKVLRKIYGPTKEKDGTWWINPYLANVENMVNPNNSSKWKMGFNSAFKGLNRMKN